jgi:hypothetical protein
MSKLGRNKGFVVYEKYHKAIHSGGHDKNMDIMKKQNRF